MQFTLSQEQYEALVAMSRRGCADENALRRLDDFLQLIERQNEIVRSLVVVQWQEADEPLPPGTDFPEVWPPELRRQVELVGRQVARADVERVVAQASRNPVNVMVTRDPAGILGYTTLDDFFR
jgi:hypothetical protein